MQQKKETKRTKHHERQERENERQMLTKHQHPPVVTTFKTRTGVVVRF